MDTLLHTCVRQSIPCLRKSHTNPLKVEPGADVILNIMFLGLFLGLYPSVNKKPAFKSRVIFFRVFHTLTTSTLDEQIVFLQGHLNLVNLALLEHVIMMTTHFMPAERHFLATTFSLDYYYQHVPTWADEFRMALNTHNQLQDLDKMARDIMDRSARVKRKVQQSKPQQLRSTHLVPYLNLALNTPIIRQSSFDRL